MNRAITVTLACAIAFAIDYAIARAGVRIAGVPGDFPPFTALPILSGCVGGVVLASIAFAVIASIFARPQKIFLFVATAALAISFALPLRLSFTKSPRFAGVTPSAQAILILMHAVVASCAVVGLLADR